MIITGRDVTVGFDYTRRILQAGRVFVNKMLIFFRPSLSAFLLRPSRDFFTKPVDKRGRIRYNKIEKV